MFTKEVVEAIEKLINDGVISKVDSLIREKSSIVGDYEGSELRIDMDVHLTLHSALNDNGPDVSVSVWYGGQRMIGTSLRSKAELQDVRVAWEKAADQYEQSRERLTSLMFKKLYS
jgi:hypothetical protein